MHDLATNWQSLYADHFRGRRVLITGGAGFIGSHIAEALVTLGASVVVIDDLSGGSTENFASFGPITFIEASILDRPALGQGDRRVPVCVSPSRAGFGAAQRRAARTL